MFKDSLIILQKEFNNLLKCKRTLIMIFGLPLMLFPVIFIGIGLVSANKDSNKINTVYNIAIENYTNETFINFLEGELNVDLLKSEEWQDYITILFPEKYKEGEDALVEIIYDSSNKNMEYATEKIQSAIALYNDNLADIRLWDAGLNRGDLSIFDIQIKDIAPDEVKDGELLSVFIPYILILFLLIGAMSLVLDVTAGEKERGAFSILLVNQISRSSIALGKTFYVILCSIINSFSSVVGMGLGFLLLINLMGTGDGAIINLSVLSFSRIFLLLIILISISAVVSSAMVYLGSLAKNLKEGSSFVMPVYMVGVLAVVITMNMDASGNFIYYLIPLINGVFIMKTLLVGQFPILNFLTCILSNFAIMGFFIYTTSRLYNSEKVLKTT